MPEPLFKVSNRHAASCGGPPAVDADVPGEYHGYFINEHGEQTIYVYDHATGEATIRMGDAGWNNVLRVVDGRVAGVTVDRAEAAWIRTCWLATGALQEQLPSRADTTRVTE